MKTVAISEFKAKCLAILEGVRRSRNPVLVTRFGNPVAEIVPPSPRPRDRGWMGSLRDTGTIEGDLVAPVTDAADWEAAGE